MASTPSESVSAEAPPAEVPPAEAPPAEVPPAEVPPAEALLAEPPLCPRCGKVTRAGAFFCAGCGVGLSLQQGATTMLPVVRAEQAWLRVRSAAFCYLALLVIVTGSSLVHDVAWTAQEYVIVDFLMALVVIAFSWPLRADLLGLLRLPRMDGTAWVLFLLGIPFFWGLNTVLIGSVSHVPGVWIADPVDELRSVGASTTTIFFIVCVTPPLVEELAFRGLLLESFRESFGAFPAAIVVSVLFSVLHVALLSFLPLAGIALVFCALRLRTGSLWPAVLGHAAFNAAALFV